MFCLSGILYYSNVQRRKSNVNQYYQALYIYGIVVVVIPVILWIARITRLVISNNEGHQVSKMLEMLVNYKYFQQLYY